MHSSNTDTAQPRSKIGVLFIHGIGEQRPGETLIAMGEPITGFLDKWVAGAFLYWRVLGLTRTGLRNWLTDTLGCAYAYRSQSEREEGLERCDAEETPALRLIAHGRGPLSHEALVKWDLYDWLREHTDSGHAGEMSPNVRAKLAKRYNLPRVTVRTRIVDPARPSEDTGEHDDPEGLPPDLIAKSGAEHNLPFVIARSRVTEAEVKTNSDVPAHMRVDIDALACDGKTAHEQWLLAEAHWANSFLPPSAMKVAIWSAMVSPYVIATVYLQQMKESWRALRGGRADVPRLIGLFRVVSGALLLPVLPPLTVFAQAALVVLGALSIVPLEIVRKRMAMLQRGLSEVIGDSLLFVRSALNCAAIVKRVRHDLEWLADRCDHVVIVAHSQGAYLAFETLAACMPRQLRLLITFGSGIERLSALRKTSDRGNVGLAGASVLACLCCWLSYEAIKPYAMHQKGVGYLTVMVIDVLGIAIVFLLTGSSAEGGLGHGWSILFHDWKVRWLDYTTADDPIVRTDQESSQRQLVTNFGSVIFDHNTYWANQDQFVPSVVNAIARAGQSLVRVDGLTKNDGVFLEVAAKWRPHRLAWLRVGSWLTSFSFAAVGLHYRDQFAAWGQVVREEVLSLKAAGFNWLDFVCAASPESIGVSLLVLAWLGTFVLQVNLWRCWDRQDTRLVVRGRDVPAGFGSTPPTHHFWAFAYLFVLSFLAGEAIRLVFDLGTVVRPFVVGPLVGVLYAALIWRARTVLNTTIADRRNLMPLKEAAAASGLDDGLLRNRCRIVNPYGQIDALGYSDSAFTGTPMVAWSEVVKVKAEVDAELA